MSIYLSLLVYLGVLINDRLQWISHIKVISQRIRKLIFVFKSLRYVADHNLLVLTYKALCQCILMYGICSWGGAAKTHLLEVERAQRTLLKVIFSLPFRHPTDLIYEKTGLLSVRKLYIFQIIRRYHRITVPALPISDKRVDLCPVPRVNSALANRQFDFLAPYIYNKINKIENMKACSNYVVKNKIIKWLQKFDYSETEKLLYIVS